MHWSPRGGIFVLRCITSILLCLLNDLTEKNLGSTRGRPEVNPRSTRNIFLQNEISGRPRVDLGSPSGWPEILFCQVILQTEQYGGDAPEYKISAPGGFLYTLKLDSKLLHSLHMHDSFDLQKRFFVWKCNRKSRVDLGLTSGRPRVDSRFLSPKSLNEIDNMEVMWLTT